MLQNSKDWELWRLNGLGSSDAPVIMGVSPYQTPFELWEQKVGIVQEKKKNEYVLQLGHEFEIKARARFELMHDIEVEPICIEHETEPWLRASLDAANIERKMFLELKYMGQKNVDLVRATKQPLPHHFPQLQHQFLVTGFSHGHYVVYSLDRDHKEMVDTCELIVKPDVEYIEKMLYPELKEFWRRVKEKAPPELTKKDLKKRSKKNVESEKVNA